MRDEGCEWVCGSPSQSESFIIGRAHGLPRLPQTPSRHMPHTTLRILWQGRAYGKGSAPPIPCKSKTLFGHFISQRKSD